MLTAVLLPNICGIFLRKMNYPKVQLVQNLHKLQIMARPITTNSTPCPPLLLLATAPIPPVPHNSVNGQRADHTKDHMGLTSWKNAPNGKIVKADVSVAKNYLQQDELQEPNEIVTMYLDYATRQARRHIPMTMQDWAEKLDAFLQFNDAEILKDKGKVTAAITKTFAESEFKKYRVIQDRQYQSDFDRLMTEAESTKQ